MAFEWKKCKMMIEKESVVFHSDEAQRWRNRNGDLYRVDGPALIFSDGTQYWCRSGGILHRDGGPAVIDFDGYEAWYVNGFFT